jgi:hypothetical protein
MAASSQLLATPPGTSLLRAEHSTTGPPAPHRPAAYRSRRADLPPPPRLMSGYFIGSVLFYLYFLDVFLLCSPRLLLLGRLCILTVRLWQFYFFSF